MRKLFTIFLILAWLPLAQATDAELDKALDAYWDNDYKTTISILKPLAKQGNAEAQSLLAYMHKRGYGTPQNYEISLKWYLKAAKQGNVPAQYHVGSSYALVKDYIKSHMWASIAKANGDSLSENLLEDIKEKMTSADIAKAQNLATQCWESKYQNCGE